MRTILKHTLLWVTIFVIYTYMMSYYEDVYGRIIVNLVNVPLFMLAYYLLRYVQIPYLYDKGRYIVFVISLIASSYMIGAICRIQGILWMDAFFEQDSSQFPFMTMGAYLLKTVRYYTPAMAILAWESHQERRKELDRISALEKEKLITELKYLKAQINPHFLFNTLNNLYSFVLNKSPKAPDMILQLSGILDYVLYRSQVAEVPLEEELLTIEHFIKLEQTRYGERLKVNYLVEGQKNILISPLILLSLVENAFKHGASGDIDQPRIDIKITALENELYCVINNTKAQCRGSINDAYKEGIGLKNIQRQLNLLYPNKHRLQIEETTDLFTIRLTIKPLV